MWVRTRIDKGTEQRWLDIELVNLDHCQAIRVAGQEPERQPDIMGRSTVVTDAGGQATFRYWSVIAQVASSSPEGQQRGSSGGLLLAAVHTREEAEVLLRNIVTALRGDTRLLDLNAPEG